MNSRRRDSMVDALGEFQQGLQSKMNQLRAIWNRVGLNDLQRKDRLETAFSHLNYLLDDMVQEEQQMERHIVDNVNNYKTKVIDMRRKLALFSSNLDIEFDSLPLVVLEARLHNEYDALKSECDKRVHLYIKLADENAKICQRLQLASTENVAKNDGLLAEISTDDDLNITIPAEHKLQSLRELVAERKLELDRRTSLVCELRLRIDELVIKLQDHSAIELSAVTKQLLHLSLSDLVLSDDNINLWSESCRQLEEKYQEFLATIRARVLEVWNELLILYEYCGIPFNERCCLNAPENEEDFSEIRLQAFQSSIHSLRAYLIKHQAVFDTIAQWRQNFDLIKEFEQKDSEGNVGRYKNRGGNLLKEQKERKRTEKRLQFLEEEIARLVLEWQQLHLEEDISFFGVPVCQYILNIKEAYSLQKEVDKITKANRKREQLEQERLYGVSPSPSKRHCPTPRTPNASGMRTPNRTRQNAAALSNSRAFVHSSLRSPVSVTSNAAASQAPATAYSASKPPLPFKTPVSSNLRLKRAALREVQQHVKTPRAFNDSVTSSGSTSYTQFKQGLAQNVELPRQSSVNSSVAATVESARKELCFSRMH